MKLSTCNCWIWVSTYGCVALGLGRRMGFRFVLLQVLKQRLAFNGPSLDIGVDRIYEEGEGLDEDEIEENQAKLPKPLSALPAGGITNGTCFAVDDQSQGLSLEIHVTHQVGITGGRAARTEKQPCWHSTTVMLICQRWHCYATKVMMFTIKS